MKGRLEHEISIKNNIFSIINEMPSYIKPYVESYYYNIQTSKEPTTCLEYLRRINSLIDFCSQNSINDVKEIDDLIIGRYFDQKSCIYTNDGDIKKISNSYKKMTWTAFNNFFTYLYKKRILDDNPMERIDKPKNNDVVNHRFLSMGDLNKIISSVNKYYRSSDLTYNDMLYKNRDLLIISLFIVTGMRKTALCEINVDDISLEEKTITVVDKRNKTQVYNLVPKIEKILLKWLKDREEILNGVTCDALFISNRKQRLCSKSIYLIVQKYSECLGTKISPHKIRGAFISLYYEQSGHDIEATREAVGHSSVVTTSRYIAKNNNCRKEATTFMADNIKI